MMLFQDRVDAGRQLSKKLLSFKGDPDLIVLGLPRGGVVVAAEVAQALQAPLDIVVPRKVGHPENPELAIGAISEEGERVFQDTFLSLISEEYLRSEIEKEKKEAQRRLKVYRGDHPPLTLKNKTAILVDDGIATGATMRAGILSARRKGAQRVTVAAPVVAPDTLRVLRGEADDVVFLDAPESFGAVGMFYLSFEQTSDDEVIEILRKHKKAGSNR
jgi:putative phosphoribosyl transferase